MTNGHIMGTMNTIQEMNKCIALDIVDLGKLMDDFVLLYVKVSPIIRALHTWGCTLQYE